MRNAVLLIGMAAGLTVGYLLWSEPAPAPAPAVVAPMPHAWQVLIVAPGHGNPSNSVALGATVGDALRAAAENGTDYRNDYSPWIAGKPCAGAGVRMICKAVRNPEAAP